MTGAEMVYSSLTFYKSYIGHLLCLSCHKQEAVVDNSTTPGLELGAYHPLSLGVFDARLLPHADGHTKNATKTA